MAKSEFPKLYTEFAKYYDRLESRYRDYPLESKWLSEVLSEESRIVDISCGTGNHLTGLSRYRADRALAMDASREMLKIAFDKDHGDFFLGDFLNIPFRAKSFDAVICMYWSFAGLTEDLVKRVMRQTNRILELEGRFIFDVENSEGIKENLLNSPFIDAYFRVESENTSVIRANFSTKIEKDVIDWRSYYLIESKGVCELQCDRMNLRFFSRQCLEDLLRKAGFETTEVLSGPYRKFEEKSPSLYFVAKKTKDL